MLFMVEIAPQVYVIDTGFVRPQCTAAYLVVHEGRALFFDTGVASLANNLLNALKEVSLSEEVVDFVMVSHVHLDHAGGAGTLLAQLPEAKLVVHPRGARHMIEPARLEASSRQVYGDALFEQLYGSLKPVPADRVIEAPDGHVINWNGRNLHFIDAPGHARHHFVMHDPMSQTVFAGDAFGLCYPEFPASPFPTTSPTQFDPATMVATYDRILALHPERVAIAHFGVITDLQNQATKLKRLVDLHVQVAEDHRNESDRIARLEESLANLQTPDAREFYTFDYHMNALGLDHWLGN